MLEITDRQLLAELYWQAGRCEGVNEAMKFKALVAARIEDARPDIAEEVREQLQWDKEGPIA